MLGQPISMLIPEVIGFELTGQMVEGTTGTDLVLKVTSRCCAKRAWSASSSSSTAQACDRLPLADRATIANMAPEYGATCGFFPIDDETLRYMRNTGRDEARVALVEAYAKENGFWRGADYAPIYTDTLDLDMGNRAGDLGAQAPAGLCAADERQGGLHPRNGRDLQAPHGQRGRGRGRRLYDGIGQGGDRLDHLLHQHLEPLCDDRRRAWWRARPPALGLNRKPWVKTSLAPGSQVCRPILRRPGCRTIWTPSGSTSSAMAAPPASATPARSKGNQRRHRERAIWSRPRSCRATATSKGGSRPDVRANYLASPPLGRGLCSGGHAWTFDLTIRAHRSGQGRQGCLHEGHLANAAGDRRTCGKDRHPRSLSDSPNTRRLQGR